MLCKSDLRRFARPLQVTALAVAAIALLGGCFPPSTLPPSATVAPGATAASIETSSGALTGTAVPASPSPAVTSTTAAAETAAPSPTAPSAEAPIPTDLAVGLVVQKADNSVQVVDANGSALPLYQAPSLVDLASIFPPGNVVSDTVYFPVGAKPVSIVKLNAYGGAPVASIPGEVYGVAALPDRLAFGIADIGAGSPTAEIRTSKLDGTQASTVYSQTLPTPPQVLRVMRWSPDGKKLYFGKEPVGLGGYILFGGLTDIWELDTASGQATELVPRPSPNAAICIDDLSPDASMAADHCNPSVMELIDVTSGVTRTVTLPAEVTDYGAVGGARFSPDGKQLAFGLARRNPDSEQGWVAIADVAGGPSRLIATSPANDYFSVVGFQDSNTVVLQSAGQAAGVWTVDTDGKNLKRVTDGVFVGILGNQQ